MANIKFSQFTAEANIANFDDIVGYQGLVNKRITPANLASSLVTLSGGPYLPLAAGAGNPLTGDLYIGDGAAAFSNLLFQTTGLAGDTVEITSQNQQFLLHERGTDMRIGPTDDIIIDDSGTAGVTMLSPTTFSNSLIDSTASAGVADMVLCTDGNVVTWRSGYQTNSIGYKSVQVFRWLNGTPTAYVNFPIGSAAFLPFDPTPSINSVKGLIGATTANYQWTCANVAGTGPTGIEAEFTLGALGGGTWEISTAQHWFDQDQFLEVNVAISIGGLRYDVIDERANDGAGNKLYYGSIIQQLSAGTVVKVEVDFQNGSGAAPFPSDSGNRPIEITFKKAT